MCRCGAGFRRARERRSRADSPNHCGNDLEQHRRDLLGRCGLRDHGKVFAVVRADRAPGRCLVDEEVAPGAAGRQPPVFPDPDRELTPPLALSEKTRQFPLWRARPGPPPRAACTIPAPRPASGRPNSRRGGGPMPVRTASSGAISEAAVAPLDCARPAAHRTLSGRPAASQGPAFASGSAPCHPVDRHRSPGRGRPGPLRTRRGSDGSIRGRRPISGRRSDPGRRSGRRRHSASSRNRDGHTRPARRIRRLRFTP